MGNRPLAEIVGVHLLRVNIIHYIVRVSFADRQAHGHHRLQVQLLGLQILDLLLALNF